MQQPAHDPEEELSRELSHQEREMKNDLYLLNELHTWISNEGVSMEKFIEKSRPLIKKFWEWNPAVAKELEEIIMSENREAILAYFSSEKEALTQVLLHCGRIFETGKACFTNMLSDLAKQGGYYGCFVCYWSLLSPPTYPTNAHSGGGR